MATQGAKALNTRYWLSSPRLDLVTYHNEKETHWCRKSYIRDQLICWWWACAEKVSSTHEMVGCEHVWHYDDVIMGTIASQITSLTSVYSTVYSGADQSKHQSSASLAFVWGIHRGPVNSPHKWPVTRKMFPFDDVIMENVSLTHPPVVNGCLKHANLALQFWTGTSAMSHITSLIMTFWKSNYYNYIMSGEYGSNSSVVCEHVWIMRVQLISSLWIYIWRVLVQLIISL